MRMVSGPNNAKVAMAGVGGSSRQVWPPVTYRNIVVTYSSINDMNKLGRSYMDGRTDAASLLHPAVYFGGRLSPQGNDAPTYEYRLIDQLIDGAQTTIETVVAPSAKSLALPSCLVLAAATDTGQSVLVEFGSNGVRVLTISGSTIIHSYQITIAVPTGSILRVERFLSWVQVFLNGVRIGATTHPSINLTGYPGVGLYSTVAPNMSTPIGATTIVAASSLARTYSGLGYFEKLTLPQQNVSFEICRFYAEGGRFMKTQSRNCRWNTGIFIANRGFSFRLNGVHKFYIGDLNGTDNQVSGTFDVPLNSVCTVEALADSGQLGDRVIKSGTVELIPA